MGKVEAPPGRPGRTSEICIRSEQGELFGLAGCKSDWRAAQHEFSTGMFDQHAVIETVRIGAGGITVPDSCRISHRLTVKHLRMDKPVGLGRNFAAAMAFANANP